jgi:hypothetical protein
MAIEDYYSPVELEPELDSMPQLPCEKCKSVQYADFLVPTKTKGLICENCFDEFGLTENDIKEGD